MSAIQDAAQRLAGTILRAGRCVDSGTSDAHVDRLALAIAAELVAFAEACAGRVERALPGATPLHQAATRVAEYADELDDGSWSDTVNAMRMLVEVARRDPAATDIRLTTEELDAAIEFLAMGTYRNDHIVSVVAKLRAARGSQ